MSKNRGKAGTPKFLHPQALLMPTKWVSRETVHPQPKRGSKFRNPYGKSSCIFFGAAQAQLIPQLQELKLSSLRTEERLPNFSQSQKY